MSPEREAQLRAEFAFDGRTGQPTPEREIEESLRRIRDAEAAEAL